jgi:hypothetical protein
MPTSSRQSQSRTKQNKNSSMPTNSPTSTCQVADSNLAFTRWTTKPQRMLKTSSNPNTLLSNTLLWTPIAPTPPNKLFAIEKITSLQVLPAYQNLPHCQLVLPHQPMQTTQSTCFVPVAKIPSSPLLRPWKVPTHLTLPPWPLLAPKFSYTSNQLVASLGGFMPPTVGTLVHH